MYLSYIAGLLGFTSGLVQAGAVPSPVSTRSSGFVSQYSDIIYNSGWLVANCPNEAGKSISSGVYLPLHVTNHQGKLQVQYLFSLSMNLIGGTNEGPFVVAKGMG